MHFKYFFPIFVLVFVTSNMARADESLTLQSNYADGAKEDGSSSSCLIKLSLTNNTKATITELIADIELYDKGQKGMGTLRFAHLDAGDTASSKLGFLAKCNVNGDQLRVRSIGVCYIDRVRSSDCGQLLKAAKLEGFGAIPIAMRIDN